MQLREYCLHTMPHMMPPTHAYIIKWGVAQAILYRHTPQTPTDHNVIRPRPPHTTAIIRPTSVDSRQRWLAMMADSILLEKDMIVDLVRRVRVVRYHSIWDT